MNKYKQKETLENKIGEQKRKYKNKDKRRTRNFIVGNETINNIQSLQKI